MIKNVGVTMEGTGQGRSLWPGLAVIGKACELLVVKPKSSGPSFMTFSEACYRFSLIFLEGFFLDRKRGMSARDAYRKMFDSVVESVKVKSFDTRGLFLNRSKLPPEIFALFLCFQSFSRYPQQQREFLQTICQTYSPLRSEFKSTEECECHVRAVIRRTYERLLEGGFSVPADVVAILYPERTRSRQPEKKAVSPQKQAGVKAQKRPEVVPVPVDDNPKNQISGAIMTSSGRHSPTAVMNPPEKRTCFVHPDRVAVTRSSLMGESLCRGCTIRLGRAFKKGEIKREDSPGAIAEFLRSKADGDREKIRERKQKTDRRYSRF